MSIKLNYRFKHHLMVAFFAIATLIFGAFGISYSLGGIIILPLTAGFIAFLICFEKKKIASVAVSVIIIGAEIFVGITDYYTPISLCSVLVAVIIAFHYLKRKEKRESALYSTIITAIVIVASTALCILGTTGATSLAEAYDYFLNLYHNFKENAISYIVSAAVESNTGNSALLTEQLNVFFDAYLNCVVALVSIFAFLLTGISHKIFSILMQTYENVDKLWCFMPSKTFAYFYFIIAILSMFTMDTTSVIDVSIANLFLIFTFVFAYIGFRAISDLLSEKHKHPFLTSLALLAFSSFSLQILATIGAFVAIYNAKFFNNDKISGN